MFPGNGAIVLVGSATGSPQCNTLTGSAGMGSWTDTLTFTLQPAPGQPPAVLPISFRVAYATVGESLTRSAGGDSNYGPEVAAHVDLSSSSRSGSFGYQHTAGRTPTQTSQPLVLTSLSGTMTLSATAQANAGAFLDQYCHPTQSYPGGSASISLIVLGLAATDAAGHGVCVFAQSQSCSGTYRDDQFGPPLPPFVLAQPAPSVTVCGGGSAAFSIAAAGTGPLAYQWQWQPGGSVQWIDVVDGVNTDPSTGGAAFHTTGNGGHAQEAIEIIVETFPPKRLRCAVTNPGGSAISEPATLTIQACCPADFDGDHQITPADVAVFVSTWFSSLQNSTLGGDFDGNGVVNPADVGAFVNAWFVAVTSGC